MTFDVHAHVIVPGDHPRGRAGARPGGRTCYRDDAGRAGRGARREGDPRGRSRSSCDIDGILAAQDEAGVERVLLCPWVPLLYYDADPDEGLAGARIQNEALARLVRDHPERVAALGALPLQEPELAAG